MVTSKLLTAEDVWNMEDDGCRHELIRGELITMSPAARPHGKYLSELARQVGNFLAERDVAEVYTGDTGFILSRDPDVLLAPDLSVIRLENLPSDPPEGGSKNWCRISLPRYFHHQSVPGRSTAKSRNTSTPV